MSIIEVLEISFLGWNFILILIFIFGCSMVVMFCLWGLIFNEVFMCFLKFGIGFCRFGCD